MLRSLFLAAVLLAQGSAPPVPMPVVRAPMIPAPASGLSDGITVTGSGSASAQAANAFVTLHVAARNNALTLTKETLQPVVDALTKAGADRATVALPAYMVGQAHTNIATITAQVHRPTQAMLQQGMVTLASTFASLPDILLSSADIRLTADNCLALQRSAEVNALTNARSNAAFLAQQLGVKLGQPDSVDARGGGAFGGDGLCTFGYSIGPYGPSYPQTGSDEMLTVKVYSNVTMRFAIKH